MGKVKDLKLELKCIGGANMHKIAWISLCSFILFFLVVPSVQAVEESFIVKEKNRGVWQVNTERPTYEQIILLYDIIHTKGLIIDDSDVNYQKVGSYSIMFSKAGEPEVSVKMIIQKTSPIEALKKPLIQLKLGTRSELTIEEIQALLENKTVENYRYKVINSSVNKSSIGSYPLVLEMMDSYGRTKQQKIMVDVLDLQAPTISIGKETLSYKVGDQITAKQLKYDAALKISDDFSASEKIELRWYLGNLNSNEAGNYKVGVRATDENNNHSAMQYVTVKIANDYSFKKSLQYEVFSKPAEKEVLADIGARNVWSIGLEKVDFTHVSTYQMPISFNDGLKGMIEVVVADTTAPIITVNSNILEYRNMQEMTKQQILADLQLKATDNYTRQLNIEFSKTLEQLQEIGQHQLVLSTKDSSGNEAQQIIQLNVGEVNEVVGAVEKNNSSFDSTTTKTDDMVWTYGEEEPEKKSNFKEKLLSPTLETMNEQVQLFQPDEEIAATIIPATKTSNFILLWLYFLLLIPAGVVVAVLFLKFPRRKKRRRVVASSNRRYTKY